MRPLISGASELAGTCGPERMHQAANDDGGYEKLE